MDSSAADSGERSGVGGGVALGADALVVVPVDADDDPSPSSPPHPATKLAMSTVTRAQIRRVDMTQPFRFVRGKCSREPRYRST
ncbi:MAG TPA: hypothetical protein VFB74_16845 [Kribbellaceae bacterium]|nr:hypothetical protein [Kribbellaceae bacterium]